MNSKYFYVGIITICFLLIAIPSTAYSTIFLDSCGWHDYNGNDPGIGTWDSATLTGTLTADLDDPVHKSIQIDDSGITFDGDGHTIYSDSASSAVYSSGTTNITVKNVITENAFSGITLFNCTDSTITDNITSNGTDGIAIYASNTTIERNISSSNSIGLVITNSNNNQIRYNALAYNSIGLYMIQSGYNTIVNNVFVDNTLQAYADSTSTGNTFSEPAPTGGNYWSDWTTPDSDGDGFVDLPYESEGGTDYLPLVNPFEPEPTDTTPPSTTISLTGTLGNNGWYVSNVEVALAATDEGGSGVALTEYSFDNSNWNIYTTPFTISTEGTTTIYYRSTDNTGNVEEAKSETIRIDKTPPEGLIISPQAYGLYEVGMALDFSAQDSLSGLSELWGTLTDADDGYQNVNSGYEPYVGVYELVVMATDQAGNDAESEPVFFVVYDPEGGFVTGGGWIYSEQGAYKPDPTLEGRANFGFVSKYKKGTTIPTGNTEFVFQAGDLNFHSSSYEWLVVTGSNYARFKGSGTINGFGEYKFQIWAEDNASDTFRIRIWEEDEASGDEWIAYDNGFDQAIEAGSIVVHTN